MTDADLDRNTAVNPLAARKMAPWLKFTLELGPLLLFFVANVRPKVFEPFVRPILPEKLLSGEHAGLFTATFVLMVTVIAALIASYIIIRRLPVMPMVTGVMVLVFGGLTFYFQDPTFVKVKVTIVYSLFGAALLGGLLFNKSLLSIVLDNTMKLSEIGWRLLTFRWGLFFFFLAGLNEIVWRTQSDAVWSSYKVFGTMILIFLFTFSQVPLIMKHELKGAAAAKAPEHV